jgi:hypothetical protein
MLTVIGPLSGGGLVALAHILLKLFDPVWCIKGLFSAVKVVRFGSLGLWLVRFFRVVGLAKIVMVVKSVAVADRLLS